MWKATRDGCGIMFDGALEYILGNGDLVMMGEFIVTGVNAGDECTLGVSEQSLFGVDNGGSFGTFSAGKKSGDGA
eukprot:7173647-Ditylum_brightwellii.AAC.1